MVDTISQIKIFEAQLDAELASLAVHSFDADQSLALAANIFEMASMKDQASGFADAFGRGMTILAPSLVCGRTGVAPELTDLAANMLFASHYYMAREYLYYSYNAPGSLDWTFTEDLVEIRFSDPSIPRQFFTVFNDMILGSFEIFEGFTASDEIRRLLKDEPEGELTPNTKAAWPLIAQEVQLKLEAYFSLLPMDSDIDLGGYQYGQFISLYKSLLGKALYHRYLSKLNDEVGAVFIWEDEIIDAAREDLGFSADVVHAILSDIVYDSTATCDRIDASYFSLLREGASGRIVMRPHHFAPAEGIVNLLRVVAQRRPKLFLDRLSNPLGTAFVRRLKSAWEAQGFYASAEVSLREFDPSLPDVDLLVISEEPTLGYVLFVCELKSPIPPRWAKDQLRVLNKDGVSKAFRQADAIRKFLGTDKGIAFLHAQLPPGGLPNFDGFVVTVQHLIITSDNAGMFFSGEDTPIINFRTLERLLKRSDGDVTLIQQVLKGYNQAADDALTTKMIEFELRSRKIRYEVVGPSSILDFPQVQWKNSQDRQEMIDSFIAGGCHPFDVLPKDPREIWKESSEVGPVVFIKK